MDHSALIPMLRRSIILQILLGLFSVLWIGTGRAEERTKISPPASEAPTPRGLVAPFLEVKETGLGEAVGYLLARELATAFGRQLTLLPVKRATDIRRFTDLLGQGYHQAAERILREHNAGALLWGAVLEHEGRLQIDSYLTVLPDIIGATLHLPFSPETGKTRQLEAPIQRTRLNFTPIEIERDDFFKRLLVVQRSTLLRTKPTRASLSLGLVKPQTVL